MPERLSILFVREMALKLAWERERLNSSTLAISALSSSSSFFNSVLSVSVTVVEIVGVGVGVAVFAKNISF